MKTATAAAIYARMLRRCVKTEDGCWVFTGATNSTGYSQVSNGERGGNILGHRLAVIVRDGEIPDDMTVDHTCHDSYTCTSIPCEHRRCVNPAHLEVVTRAENTARQWDRRTCRKGHELTARGDGKSRCKTCAREYAAAWRAARIAS